MGYTEFIVVLCFVVTLWTNTANADIDCRRHIFAPMCRGISAKRSWPQVHNHNSNGLKESDTSEEQRVSIDDGEEEEKFEPKKIPMRTHKTSIDDVLKTSLLRRSKDKEVEDMSDGCGAKFNALIVSPKFDGLQLLQRHRLVNDILAQELKSIHAFTMKTLTPNQYSNITNK